MNEMSKTFDGVPASIWLLCLHGFCDLGISFFLPIFFVIVLYCCFNGNGIDAIAKLSMQICDTIESYRIYTQSNGALLFAFFFFFLFSVEKWQNKIVKKRHPSIFFASQFYFAVRITTIHLIYMQCARAL